MIKIALLAMLALVCAASNADARPRHSHRHHKTWEELKPIPDGSRIVVKMHRTDAAVVDHPSGCPARAFCGCGASVRVFGHAVRELWLASNWFRFPRAAPAAGMVAVRSHHVFVLEEHIDGDTWQVFDANSGGRLTRIHARSIAGYTIVDPRGRA